ncbi:GNAT family acetyltransferase [Sporosarcina newyorkensis 2681]|uniref:GNAT family acetyltransferase n=1 Tax=Sporosarcina newyorkensis 2681 TaxID=1027292 RepID=F9DS63_9BACL|nr:MULTISPECIES: GNAT family N-acetyltransferase [Sporosarcina]EGQ26363.1 GNAT family acetyltransferase [Sporosarcina newyorkensis 2681]
MKLVKKVSSLSTLTIKELQSETEILQAFPVMKQLRGHLDEQEYLKLTAEAREKDQYRMYALYDQEELVAVTGFKPMITLYYGRFVWICDLVTDETKRSAGYGEALLTFIHEWARDNDYASIALSSGLQRHDAHRFYENKMDYDRVSYVFKKNLF